MARDWSLSRFVRLYVVESADESAWDWQARCVWPLLIKAADRAGVIETTKGARGIAAQIRMPLEVVEPAIAELTADGCLTVTARGYVLRNYVEAQTARMAGSQRQAEYKARERADSALGSATNSNGAHAEVTRGDARVTPGNAEVTPIRDDPRRAEQRREKEIVGPATPTLVLVPPAAERPDPVQAFADHAIGEINRVSGRVFARASKATMKLCRALVKSGATAADVTAVVERKAAEWLGSHMAERVCPGTLLAADNFARYLDEIRAGPPSRAGPSRPPASSIDATAQALRDRGYIP